MPAWPGSPTTTPTSPDCSRTGSPAYATSATSRRCAGAMWSAPTCSTQDSPARTSAPQDAEPASRKGPVPVSGRSSWTPFAIYDRTSSCWRTWPRSAGKAEGSTGFSRTWPARGTTRDGVAYAPATSVRATGVSGCSLLPTPCASDGHRGPADPHTRKRRGRQVRVGDVLCHPPHTPACVRTRTAHTRLTDRLLPTPLASDATKGSPRQRSSSGHPTLPSAALATHRTDPQG